MCFPQGILEILGGLLKLNNHIAKEALNVTNKSTGLVEIYILYSYVVLFIAQY